ncbi:hypothetical protein PQR53_18525 [Paraburkholderia fungorum]|uniref:hypothetical protein n=1 Tax=Paraburkholderia fungorum TaxID=134537 RepID=UPI0038BC341A
MQSLTCELSTKDGTHETSWIYRSASPTELTYIETNTVVVSRSSIAGKITREQFDTAIFYLEARFSILRSIVLDGQFVARMDDSPTVATWLSSDSCSVDAVYASLLNSGLDTRTGIYSVHVVAGDDALDVFMRSSHAITDATSLVELHSCLAYICDCVARGNAHQAPVALNISDMQAVKFHWPTERLKVTGFEYALGWHKKFPNVSVSVYEGKLIANTVYVEEFFEPETIPAICESVARKLQSAC